MDIGDEPQGDIVDGQLVIAGAQGTALLEPPHHPLDDVPLAVARLVELFLTRLLLPCRDHRFEVVPPQPGADAGVAVALVRHRPARRGRRARPLTSANACDSCRCPGVTVTANRMPTPQQTRLTLVPKPPCE